MGQGHSPTDSAVVKDFLESDRWGLGIKVRQRVKEFYVFSDYTDYLGGSAAALLAHLQQLAAIKTAKARTKIQFVSRGQCRFFRSCWQNMIPFLQGLSVTVFPVLVQLVKAGRLVVIRLEGVHTFEVKRDELTVTDWTREFRKVFLP